MSINVLIPTLSLKMHSSLIIKDAEESLEPIKLPLSATHSGKYFTTFEDTILSFIMPPFIHLLGK
jgi:hypothetical protein